MCELEHEAVRIGALIQATEDWSTEYKKDATTHAKLMKLSSKWEIQLRKYFRKIAKESHNYLNWAAYVGQVKADYNVEVIVNDDGLDQYYGEFITISFETVTELMAAGAIAGETIYKVPLGISSTDANIQKLGMDTLAALIGKKVQKDGTIVDNPKAEMNILDTVRQDIAQSIKTSLALGEDLQTAIARVEKVIDNPRRSEMIARTESVNAYQSGLMQFGIESDAKGKEWQTVGGCAICEGNVSDGPIPIDAIFSSGDDMPTAHPNCRCGLRYIYQEEWDSLH